MSDVSKKTNLKKGQTLDSGFVILDVVDLEELNAEGIWAKHEKTGVEVFHVLNDDIENLFSFVFKTIPQDDTGVAHILEHSVLCGSERYPLKDAFAVLDQGSLKTYLNAETSPDKTVYPASSTNERDYFNLMSVYGNAVFRPLLPEWTFMQEGHRLEYQDGKLSITGVVYNEMRGYYSSMDTYAGHWSAKAVMPDTPYSFDFGGDPEHIPELSWESFKEFHRRHYSPANCRIFLAGNIPTEKQLSFLNEQFFSNLSGGKSCDPIKKVERWKESKIYHIPCPAGSESKSTIFLSWLCSDVTDVAESIALDALAEILLGHDGSPLLRALIESELGEDTVSGHIDEIRETLFVIGLKGVDGDAQQKGKEVEDLVMGELRRLFDNGIPAEEIEAALLTMEFSLREICRFGSGPFSLVWMHRSLQTWLHGCKPWESLLLQPLMLKIKENLASGKRYFESLIKKYFLDNPHRALVILEPKEDFLPKQEEKLAASLADTEKNLSGEERQNILEKSEMLEKIQNEADSPEALAAIPHLSRSDLSTDIDYIHRRHEDLKGVPALCHELYTNGITYADIAFPVVLFHEDYFWLPFFSRAILSVGLPGMDYGEVSNLLARTTGGLIVFPYTRSAVSGTARYLQTASGHFDLLGRDWIIFRLKCLDEKIAQSLDLILRFISEVDFTDHRRINDLVLEMKNYIDSSLAPNGDTYASVRAGRRNSYSKNILETWYGISQIDFVHRFSKMDTAAIACKLEYLREKITGSGLIVNLTGGALNKANAEFAQRFGRFGPPAPRASVNSQTKTNESNTTEVFASKSLQIGFAARTLNAAPFDTNAQIAEMVLTHQLSTGALFENIRMKGGAYGVHTSSNSLEDCVSFFTNCDPNPLRSLDTISALLKDGSYGNCTEDYLVKSIIGCYAEETYPRTSAENGFVDFIRFLYGIEDSHRKRRMERLVSVSTADIAAAFDSLGSRAVSGTVIIAGAKMAEQAAAALGTEVQMLPV
ncbi:MAG: insulinase family protein [Treponema sp.]|nr:insulinase family protein [Treponema sp.]